MNVPKRDNCPIEHNGKKGMEFIEFEFPRWRINGEDYIVGLDDAGILKHRRKHLGLTQQQVAKLAGIQVKQYQRLESGERSIMGASMRIGLSVCAVLKLDPYGFVGNAEKNEQSNQGYKD